MGRWPQHGYGPDGRRLDRLTSGHQAWHRLDTSLTGYRIHWRITETVIGRLMEKHDFHLTIDEAMANAKPSELLAKASGLSQQRVKEAMQKGAVWLSHAKHTRRLRRHKSKLAVGDELHLYYDPAILSNEPLPARLISDEKHYTVWFKPAGMLSQGSKWGDHTTLSRWAATHLTPERPVFLVHRLDRAASGLMMLAHSKQASRALTAKFEERRIEKIYQVSVNGKFPGKPEEYLIDTTLDDKAARSWASRKAFDPDSKISVLHVRIETGRKHQIRRHLSGMGFPVVGDRLYGDPEQEQDLQLQAISLSFVCPFSGERKQFSLDESTTSLDA